MCERENTNPIFKLENVIDIYDAMFCFGFLSNTVTVLYALIQVSCNVEFKCGVSQIQAVVHYMLRTSQ